MPGRYRSAELVKPGWLVKHDDTWHLVHVPMHAEDATTGRKRVHAALGDGCGASWDFGEQVLTLTPDEARDAGMGDDQ